MRHQWDPVLVRTNAWIDDRTATLHFGSKSTAEKAQGILCAMGITPNFAISRELGLRDADVPNAKIVLATWFHVQPLSSKPVKVKKQAGGPQ